MRLKLRAEEAHVCRAESHLPAGLEAIDFQLKTSPKICGKTESSDGKSGVWWESVWKHVECRDDRVFLFSENLHPGVYEYEFLAQAITPGELRIPPARVYEFYNPKFNAHTEGKLFNVKAK